MKLGRKTLGWLSFFVAVAVFAFVERFFYRLWWDVDRFLRTIPDQPGVHTLNSVNKLSLYAFAGGLIISGLAAITVFIFLMTRSRAALTSRLLASQEWLEELYEEAPIPYLLMVPKGNLELPNKAALRLFGCTADVLALRTLADIIVEDDREDMKNLLDLFKRRRPINNKLVRIESKNKEVRSVLLSVFPGGSMERSSAKALVTMVDISEQKRLENEVRAQFNEVQKFAKAAESSTDGVIITDNDGRITYINMAWMQLTGFTTAIPQLPKSL